MKISIWTQWYVCQQRLQGVGPKCIHVTESDYVPRVGDYVLFAGGQRMVRKVLFDLLGSEVQITIDFRDLNDDYEDVR